MKPSTHKLKITTFLVLWYCSSSTNVIATNIFCPGLPPSQYCDCEGDCTGNPEFCGCEEAQACCKDAIPVVLCPDQPEENYCDCTGDCTKKPEWCQCEEAQECCNKNSLFYVPSSVEATNVFFPEVLCPGQPEDNFCDCTGDCFQKPEWCQCEEAKECCNNNSISHLPIASFVHSLVLSKIGSIVFPLLCVNVSFLIWFLLRQNKNKKEKTKAPLSGVPTKTVPLPTFSSTTDTETITSTE